MSVFIYKNKKLNVKKLFENIDIEQLGLIIYSKIRKVDFNKRIVFTGEGNAGKTTLAYYIAENFQGTVLEIDHFIKNRDYRKSKQLSGYNPKSFNLLKFKDTRNKLHQKQGNFVFMPFYQHNNGVVCKKKVCTKHKHKLLKNRIIIEVGTFLWKGSLENERTNNYYFASIDDKYQLRYERDTRDRGYSKEYAIQHIQQLKKDEKYITESILKCKYFVMRNKNKYSLYLIKGVVSCLNGIQ